MRKKILMCLLNVRLSRLLWVAAIWVVLLGLLEVQTISYSQAQAWGNPRLLSADSFAWFPDIVVDQGGNAHIVWSSGVPGYDTVNHMTRQSDGMWGEVNDIVALPQVAGSEATRPSLLVDANNILHMTYRSTLIYYASAPAESAGKAPAWGKAVIMSDPSQVGYFSRMAMDHRGRLHLVLTWNVPALNCAICYHVFYRYSDDQGSTWSEPVDLSKADGAAKPQIIVDRQDNVFVVWERGIGGSYGRVLSPVSPMYVASYDRGLTWTSPTKVSVQSEGLNITVGHDNRNQLVMAWLGLPENLVYFQVSKDAGRTWTNPEAIKNVWGGWSVYPSLLDTYSMATDAGGNLHLVIAGRINTDQENLNVLHLVWDGSKWIGPEVIKSLVGDVPEWPRIAVGLGNQLHVVWFERDQANIWNPDSGRYSVWYAFNISNAPSVSPVRVKQTAPAFTITPTQQATATPSASPIPTLLPVSRQKPGDQSFLGVGKPVYSEKDYLILLGKILVPPVFFLFVSLVVLLYRRR